MTNEELLTLKEAADLLKVSPPTIYSWVHQKLIPYRKHGSRLAFERNDLLKWSKSKEIRPLEEHR